MFRVLRCLILLWMHTDFFLPLYQFTKCIHDTIKHTQLFIFVHNMRGEITPEKF